tara:strand:+ start:1328 stop:1510 length:183 start_codon:yes stop_codon:yes gene_type:complete
MEYEIDAIDADSGFFSGGHEKLAKQFQKISQKRVADGWKLHSYDTCVQGKTMYATLVWQR